MKPNSCVYRAVKRIVEYQFGITGLESDIFDKYNNGDGIPTEILATAIDEALDKFGVKVAAIVGHIDDPEKLDRPHLFRREDFFSAPCIGYNDQHVEAVLPGEFLNGAFAIVLERAK